MVEYCGSCGAKLKSREAVVCVKCGANPRKFSGFCPSCGAEGKSPDAKTCVSCGAGFGRVTDKDPSMVALIAVFGLLLLAAPSLGHIYLGKVKKGFVLLLVSWGLFVLLLIPLVLSMGLCFPIIFVPYLLGIYFAYDAYLDAKGESTLLSDMDS